MHGMPVVTDEHRKLHVFAGSWVGDETLAPSPWGAGGPAVGKYAGRIECDGFFVSQDYIEEKDGKVSYRGHGVFGYDTAKKKYSWYWVDSMGSVPAETSWGSWEGDRLQFTSSSPMGLGRYTFELSGRDKYSFKIENSFDGGGSWKTFMTGEYRRV
jgi:hypothetical protein